MIKTSFSDFNIATDNLRKQAEGFLRSKIKSEPENVSYLIKLAHLLRKTGNLHEASMYLKKALALEPNNAEAGYLVSILDQKLNTNPCKKAYCPAPFLYIEDFLSPDEFSMIWSTIEKNKNYFKESVVYAADGTNEVDSNLRKSKTLYKKNLGDISEWILSKIYKQLPEILPYLNLDPFKPTSTEIQLTRHGNNDFFMIHQDSNKDIDSINNRTLTFVLYVHQEPKHFNGGEILLFDTDTQTNNYNDRFTRLTPSSNSIIFFPSNYFHQVMPVYLLEDIFEYGRFAIHGWLHK